MPAGEDERTEVRLPLGRATRTVPRALTREVRAIVRDRPLVPIAVLHTRRIERRLLDGKGQRAGGSRGRRRSRTAADRRNTRG